MGLFGLNTNFLSSIVCKLQVHDNRLNVKTSILIRRLSYSDRRDKLVPNKVEKPHSILIKNFPVLCQWHDLVKLNYKIGMILVACWSPLQAGKLDNIKSEVGIC